MMRVGTPLQAISTGPHVMSLRILVHAPYLPRADFASGDRRFVALLGMLAKRHTVDVCFALGPEEMMGAITLTQAERYFEQLRRLGVTILGWGKAETLRSLTHRYYDLLFVEFAHLVHSRIRTFRFCQPHARVIVDSVDIHFARFQTAARLGFVADQEVERMKDDELKAYRAADAIIVVTAEDENVLAAEPPMPPRFLVPNVVPIVHRGPGPREREVLFVGGFQHEPNVDGIEWFAREVWPGVRSAVPNAKLSIVGSNPPQSVQALGELPGITVTGFVPETGPYLERAAVAVAPLRIGGGMKGKVSEALAHGVPVVTTGIGAQGFGGTHGEHYWIADDAHAFQSAVIHALREPILADRVGVSGQRLVSNICSPATVARLLDAAINCISPSRPSITATVWHHLASVPYRLVVPFVRLMYR